MFSNFTAIVAHNNEGNGDPAVRVVGVVAYDMIAAMIETQNDLGHSIRWHEITEHVVKGTWYDTMDASARRVAIIEHTDDTAAAIEATAWAHRTNAAI